MSCRVLKNGDAQITQNYEAHLIKCASSNGWAKGTDIVKKPTQCEWITAHTSGKIIKVVNYLDGTNKKVDREGMGYGNYVMILHDNNYVTLYAHLNQVKVVEGNSINAGDVIGFMGNTGNSSGAHLHFEVRHYNCMPNKNNLHNVNAYAWFNPETYINADLPEQNSSNTKAVGFLDATKYENRSLTVAGWAYHNGGSKKVEIKLFDGTALVKTLTTIANLHRPDVRNAMGYTTDSVGYSATIPVNLPNAVYKVKAYVDGTELTNLWVIEVKEQVLTRNSYSDYPLNSNDYYRVRLNFKDEKTAMGSYHKYSSAYDTWVAYKSKGYHLYDKYGHALDSNETTVSKATETTPTTPATPKTLARNSYSDYKNGSDDYYRVRLSFSDSKSSIGSWHVFSSAYDKYIVNKAKGYHIYDTNGNQLD